MPRQSRPRLSFGLFRQAEGEAAGTTGAGEASSTPQQSSSSRRSRPGKRRLAREARQAAHLAERQALAGDDPAANAVLSWDRLRRQIKALPPARRANAWHRVRAELDGLREDLDSRNT